MSNYAVFFDKDNATYRLPVNPEQIETSSSQAIKKFEILKKGQIAVPTHMELSVYSFEAEFPHEPYHYVETSGAFKNADFYLNLFQVWRENLEPVRFIASNGIGNDINTLVLIESLDTVEKAGEEGDKYISFSLVEYRSYGKKSIVITSTQTPLTGVVASTKEILPTPAVNPKNSGSHVVQSDDTLWAIAKRCYGDGSQYPKIVAANKIKNPNLVYSGQELVIPV